MAHSSEAAERAATMPSSRAACAAHVRVHKANLKRKEVTYFGRLREATLTLTSLLRKWREVPHGALIGSFQPHRPGCCTCAHFLTPLTAVDIVEISCRKNSSFMICSAAAL